MAVRSQSRYVVGASALVWILACGDSSPEPREPEDAGPGDAEVDAGPPGSCCEDEACTRVTDGACAAGELCTLDTSGLNGTCSAGCPEAQACGDLCCPWGASCEKGQCQLSDLSVEVKPNVWPYPASKPVGEADCMAVDSCLPSVGRYTLLETGLRVKNAGKAPFKLSGISTRDDMDVSFCQGSYLMRDFIHAKVKDAKGKVVREADLPTLCTQEGEDYVCGVSGLSPGKKVDLPSGACDQLDVTGLPKGDYLVEMEVNPKHTVAEQRFDNNVASYTFSHTGCDGFLCDGECCPPDVMCVDGTCARPNLAVREDALRDSVYFTGRVVAGDMCSQEERCTLELGDRRLLGFETRIENVGTVDLSIAEGDPLMEQGCFGQLLTKDIVQYRLLDAQGEAVLEGHRRNLCLSDVMYNEDPAPGDPTTQPWQDSMCGKLTAGMATVYGSAVSCQWLDVTDVAPGRYKLEVTFNPERTITEENYEDNIALVEVDVPAATCLDEEVCDDDIDQDCDNLPDSYDEDCGGGPGPEPEDYVATHGNLSCATAHDVTGSAWLSTELEALAAPETCGAGGASAFYVLNVSADEIVYADAFDSESPTSLLLHGADCGAPVECSQGACGWQSGQLVRTLTPGRYVLEARTKDAEAGNAVRVRIHRVPAANVQLIREPGVVEGDTSDAANAEIAACVGWDEQTDEEISRPMAGPHDLYVIAHCDTYLTVSTCGTAAFASAGAFYDDVSEPTYMCSEFNNQCLSDPEGFSINTYMDRGLDTIVVGAQTEGAKGAYQLQLSF